MLLTFWYVYFRSFFSSVVLNQVVHSLSHVRLFVTPWTAACQASLPFTISQSLFKLMSIELMMPSNHLILCHPLLLLPSILPTIRVFFKRVHTSHQVAKVLELQLQHQSFQWILRVDFLPLSASGKFTQHRLSSFHVSLLSQTRPWDAWVLHLYNALHSLVW